MRIRTLITLAAAPAIAALALVPGTAPATAVTASAPFEMINANSHKCVEVYNWSTAAGANVDQWTCGGNHANQLWQLVHAVSSAGYQEIRNVNSGMCMEPETSSPGALIVQEPCNASNLLQEWYEIQSNTSTKTGTYQNAALSGTCCNDFVDLDVDGGGTANRTPIDDWWYNGNSNQIFTTP
jgi:hypothetical protein